MGLTDLFNTPAGKLVGKQAPDFRLQDQDGNWVRLSDLTSQGPVMLAFYPGDFTPVCTKQLCGYQDSLARFRAYGLNIVGISPDSAEKHRKFIAEYGFEFPLLTDGDKQVFKEYGVISRLLLGIRSRAIFIVKKGGEVVYEKVEATSLTHRDSEELLETVKALKGKLG
ncbi:MAG TPA: peroxiredoxin [Bdellovibrionota bacterium]|jgi:peroxiredoxin Q/BCP|nr:peroxiredoxin [Bdellovibrionota bacterium]